MADFMQVVTAIDGEGAAERLSPGVSDMTWEARCFDDAKY